MVHEKKELNYIKKKHNGWVNDFVLLVWKLFIYEQLILLKLKVK